jgi:hypothetical protein
MNSSPRLLQKTKDYRRAYRERRDLLLCFQAAGRPGITTACQSASRQVGRNTPVFSGDCERFANLLATLHKHPRKPGRARWSKAFPA